MRAGSSRRKSGAPVYAKVWSREEPRHDRGGRLIDIAFEQPPQTIGIALHDRRRRIARAQQPAKIRIELTRISRRGSTPCERGPRSRGRFPDPFDHRPLRMWIDIARHRTREHPARRHHCAGREWLFDPRTDELHLVIETQLFFSTRATECKGIAARSRVQAAGLAATFTGIGRKAGGQDGLP